MELVEKTAGELRDMLDRKEVSSVELVKALLDRIEKVDGAINAYVSVRAEEALEEAKEADRRLAQGEGVTPLTGIPVSVKDNLCTAGTRTTCSSKMLAEFVPPYDATVVARLKAAGAPIVGKLNMDEFAMGSSTETSAFGITRNPWDGTRVPGGSSGGAAAAVAARTAILALGTDTGGSIRQPAAFCGVVGMKPTYGRVSRYGAIAFASSMDQVGPMARSVEDCARLLQAIAGGDPNDATSLDEPVPDYGAGLHGGVEGLVIGVPKEFFGDGIDPDVEAAVKKAIQTLQDQGAQVVEVSLPHSQYALASYCIIGPAEASSNLGRFDGVRYGYRAEDAADVTSMFGRTRAEGFGPEVKRRMMLGAYVLSADGYEAYYRKAQQVRTLVRQDFDEAFTRCDLLALPTTATTAFALGERSEARLDMYKSDLCTVTANLAGIPALSVPCGLDADGLPIGLQLVGPAFAEERLLRAAYTYEQAAGLAPLKPEMEWVK